MAIKHPNPPKNRARPMRFPEPIPEASGPVSIPQSRVAQNYYLSAKTEPQPSVRVELLEGQYAGEKLWRVRVDNGNARLVHRPGLGDRGRSANEILDDIGKRKETERHLEASALKAGEKAARSPRVQRPIGETCFEYRGALHRPLVVFPPDQRDLLTDSSWPWRLIGKVTTSDGKGASGALVGGRIMLTARHVRPVNSIAARNWWIQFTPHYFDGMTPFGTSFVSNNEFYQFTGDTGFDLAHDYMVCRLFEPLGDQIGFFGAEEYSEDWNDDEVWASVGYPGDLAGGERPFVQVNCSIEDSREGGDGQTLETEADLNHGDSGGPFWAWFNNGDPRIIGVTSDEVDFATNYVVTVSHDLDNSVAGGKDMVELIRWARQNWT